MARTAGRQRVKYACCKHGPDHIGRMPTCGYAHTLAEVALPERIDPRQWLDTVHEPGGHAGIDWFVGQAYSPAQMQRMMTMLANELPERWPSWARMLAWFLELMPASRFVSDGIFSGSRVSEFVAMVPSDEVLRRPFALALDGDGRTLEERIERRGAAGRWYELWAAAHIFTPDEKYSEGTTMHWGPASRQYLQSRLGHE